MRAETATLATIANTSPPDSVSASRVEQLTLEAESHMAEAWRLEKEARVEEKEASVADLELAPDRNTWMEATAIRAREKRVRAESVFRPRAA